MEPQQDVPESESPSVSEQPRTDVTQSTSDNFMSPPANVTNNAPSVDGFSAGSTNNPVDDANLSEHNDTSAPQPQVFGPQQAPALYSNLPPQQGSTNGLNPGQTSFMNTDSNLPRGPKKKLPRAKLLLVLVALLIIGFSGGALAYVNILNNSPEKVLADALANTMKDALDRKPLQLVSNIKLKSKDSKNPYELIIDLDGARVGENGKLTVKAQFITQKPKVDITVSSDMVVQDDKTVYIRLNDLQKSINQIGTTYPLITMMAKGYQPVIEKIDGKWIKFDTESLTKMGLERSEKEINKCTEAAGNLRISDKDSKRVKEIFKQNQFAIASEELPAESVDGDKSFHYKLDLNEEAGILFVKELADLDSFKDLKNECKIKQEDLNKDLQQLKEDKEKSETKPIIELWVSKKTRHITRTLITVDDKEVALTMSANTKINAQNLTVEIPKDSIKLEDLQKDIEDTMQKAQEDMYRRTTPADIESEDELMFEQQFNSGNLHLDSGDLEQQL